MIRGTVTADREAVVRLVVRASNGTDHETNAVIDTGFDGWLTLPGDFVKTLGLTWQRRGRAIMADGKETFFDSYSGTVIWDGNARRVAIDAAETIPLVGMALLNGYELCMEVISGGKVSIRILP